METLFLSVSLPMESVLDKVTGWNFLIARHAQQKIQCRSHCANLTANSQTKRSTNAANALKLRI